MIYCKVIFEYINKKIKEKKKKRKKVKFIWGVIGGGEGGNVIRGQVKPLNHCHHSSIQTPIGTPPSPDKLATHVIYLKGV